MDVARSAQADELAQWMSDTVEQMSGQVPALRPVEDALPELAAMLRLTATTAMTQASGTALHPDRDRTLRILWGPGRIRVCLDEAGYETSTDDSPTSLEESVFTAAYALIQSETEY